MPKTTFYNLEKEKQDRIIDAAIDEFANHPLSLVKLSNIIKKAKIPRGSFYQYFDDKNDLYIYIFDLIKNEKLKYMDDLLPNPEQTPFIVLFKELYIRGLNFALENPKYIKISKHLFDSRGQMYQLLIGEGLELAKEYYISYVETDKSLGRIREDIDSELLANLFIQATTQIAFDEILTDTELNKGRMLSKVDGLITLLKKGIE